VPISAETSSSCADDVVVVVLAEDAGEVLERVATSALSKHKIRERTARGQGAATRRRSSVDGVVGLLFRGDKIRRCVRNRMLVRLREGGGELKTLTYGFTNFTQR
jgi:hypothetical protein